MGHAPEPLREEILSLIVKAKEGCGEAREAMIRRCSSFALSVASRVSGRYVALGEDDEASIAMMALDEAISEFDPDLGGFFPFASLVIRRRILDFLRKKARNREVAISSLEEGAVERLLSSDAVPPDEALEERSRAEETREDVLEFVSDLREYGFEIGQLVSETPRHADTRNRLVAVGKMLADDEEMLAYLLERKRLPMSMLTKASGLSRRTLERHRRYLVALGLAFSGRYPSIRRYLIGR